jgi:hypothetical protein
VNSSWTIQSVLPYDTINYGSRACAATGVQSTFLTASGPASDRLGNLYISDFGVRKLAANGAVSTIAGTGTAGYSGEGGLATSAQVVPGALAVDRAGNIYIADSGNNVVRVLRPTEPRPVKRPPPRPVNH